MRDRSFCCYKRREGEVVIKWVSLGIVDKQGVVCDESKVKELKNVPLSELIDSLQIIRLENKDEVISNYNGFL